MTVPTPAVRRARTAEAKEQRATALTDAARRLALRKGVRAVTLTDITGDAGVHVSAVRRYFESREQIFLRLTAEGWQEWSRAVRAEIGAGPLAPGDLAALLARSLAERPLLCDLFAHTPLSLEREVSLEAVRDFKLVVLDAATALAEAIVAAVPGLDPGDGRDLVATVSALAGTFWQTSHPPETLDLLYREDPRLAHAAVEFAPRLAKLTLASTLGLIAAHGTAP